MQRVLTGFTARMSKATLAMSIAIMTGLCACSKAPDSMPSAATEQKAASETIAISRSDYRDRLIALWLAQSIANWTGLVTEGMRTKAPFYTDKDWGTEQGSKWTDGPAGPLITFNFLDPWGADDDTDIEYIYLEAMAKRGDAHLTPEEIRAAWMTHIKPVEPPPGKDKEEYERYIWVANWVSDRLMRRTPPVYPPSTSLLAANNQALMIDAQLTTEFFGALAPGMPRKALELADLPIQTTAAGYAAHASQFFATLYSLAPVVDRSLAPKEQVLWLVRTARRVIPDGSKAADVIDLVLADYLANPDRGNWERTRDLIYDRFHLNADKNGYKFLFWYEAPVNLGGGLLGLLYGEGDLKETIRIGSLSGWDSDNGTASMGGLLGLLLGTDNVRKAFPEQTLSLQYRIARTRVGFDREVESIEAIADRMLPLVDKVIVEAGGTVDGDIYRIPKVDFAALSAANDNPRTRDHGLSANNLAGARAIATIEGGKAGTDSAPAAAIADGLEFDFSGRDRKLSVLLEDEYQKSDGEQRCVRRDAGEPITISVQWAQPAKLGGLRLVEGANKADGGQFESLEVFVRDGETWKPAQLAVPYASDSARQYAIHALRFTQPLETNGIRVRGAPAGSARYITVCELDGLLAM